MALAAAKEDESGRAGRFFIGGWLVLLRGAYLDNLRRHPRDKDRRQYPPEGNNRPALNRASEHRPNVVIFVADALRAQNMSLYGYGRKTTPFLERFADQSMVFTEMHSNSTSTRTSLTTILSGKNRLTHGRLTKFLAEYDSPENLVALLRDRLHDRRGHEQCRCHFLLSWFSQIPLRGECSNFLRLTLSFLRDNGIYPTNPGTRMYIN